DSGELKASDFVNTKNVIPQASLADYVSCFQSCLESKPADEGAEADCRCDLVPQAKDSWTLRFVLALKLYASVWRPTFEVTLKSIPLQKIDILAAQLRDLQEEMAHLRSERDVMGSARLVLQTTQQAESEATLLWKVSTNYEGNTPEQFEVDRIGKVRFLQAERYLVNLTLVHQAGQECQELTIVNKGWSFVDAKSLMAIFLLNKK
ncbi:hypothetical protein Gpo141_00008654, partial [Globisporangium polare]